MTDDDNVQRVVDEIIAAEGRIDLLVNNAGVFCIGVPTGKYSILYRTQLT